LEFICLVKTLIKHTPVEVPHCEPVDLQTLEQSEVPPPVEEDVVSHQVETETDTADAVMTEQEVSEPMMEEHMPQGETSSQSKCNRQ
jgi:hypothetical protein